MIDSIFKSYDLLYIIIITIYKENGTKKLKKIN